MKSVGCAKSTFGQAEKEVLRAAVHLSSEFDTAIRPVVETPDDRALDSVRCLQCSHTITQSTAERGYDLSHRQI